MSTLRSATIRLAYQVPSLRPHLMSVLAASVADEVADAFWEGVQGGSYDEGVTGVKTEEVDLDWEREAIGGYGHGDDWEPTQYAEGSSSFDMPSVIKYELRGTIEVDLPVSPAEVERILERVIKLDGPGNLVKSDSLNDAVVDTLPDGVTLARPRSPAFTISKCDPRVTVREVDGGFDVRADIKVYVEVSDVEVKPPEPSYDGPDDYDDEPDDYDPPYDSRYEP